ncbi:MAG: cytochrome c peroxidase [Bacteroidota bacterium]
MRIASMIACLCSISLLFVQCASDDDQISLSPTDQQGPGDDGGPDDTPNPQQLDPRALPLRITDPANNPSSAAKIALGRALFWDPILSGQKDIACATCHHPAFGYGDGLDLSIGVGGVGLGPNRRATDTSIPRVARNAPTIVNTAYNGIQDDGSVTPERAPMFWDNRAQSLEEQALLPTQSFNEMRGHAFSAEVTVDSIVARLRSIPQYRSLFAEVFGGNNAVNADNLARAIASFERSVVAGNSPFDRYARGDETALTAQELRGLQRFDAVGCGSCHSGPMFSDFELHVIGVPDNRLLDESDSGANGSYRFRTPTLRNLPQTGPYFHNGVASDLTATLNFYLRVQNPNGGGGPGGEGLNLNPNVAPNQLSDELQQLRLNRNDIQDIVAFLRSLDDDSFDTRVSDQVPSGLPVGGNL